MSEHKWARDFEADVDSLFEQGYFQAKEDSPEEYCQDLLVACRLHDASAVADPGFRLSLERRFRDRIRTVSAHPGRRGQIGHNLLAALEMGLAAVLVLAFVLGLSWIFSTVKPASVSSQQTPTALPTPTATALPQPTPAEYPTVAPTPLPLDTYPTIPVSIAEGPSVGTPSAMDSSQGEIYFMLESVSAPFQRNLVRMPAGCLTENTCAAVTVPGFPGLSSFQLAWTPDGKLAAMNDSNSTRLLIFNPQDNTWTSIAENFFITVDQLFWSPDGAWIAATVQNGDNSSLITLIRPDGSEQHTFAADLGGMQIPLGWLDANTLLFVRHLDQPKGHPEITPEPARLYRLDVQGNSWNELSVPDKSQLLLSYPAISPDRSQIALTLSAGESGELALLSADGLSLQSLGIFGGMPVWSPDGQWISFIQSMDRATDVYVIHPDGSGLQKVFSGAVTSGIQWSPDGGHLLIETSAPEQDPAAAMRTAAYWVSVSDGTIMQLSLQDKDAKYNIRYPTSRMP